MPLQTPDAVWRYIKHAIVIEGVGSIHMASSGKVMTFINKVFEAKHSITAPGNMDPLPIKEALQGFCQVNNSKKIYHQLLKLKNKQCS